MVLEILVVVCPDRAPSAGLPGDELRLGRDGLGLDSIEIVEVLLGCEEHYDAPIDALLDGRPLTFGRLVDHFAER